MPKSTARELPQPSIDYLRDEIRRAVNGPISEEMLQLNWAWDYLPIEANYAASAISSEMWQVKQIQPELWAEQKAHYDRARRQFYWDLGRKEEAARQRRLGRVVKSA